MDFKIITVSDIENAREYVPFAEKERFVDEVADKCFTKMEVSANYDNSEQVNIPPMFKENIGVKMRFALGALVKLYLQKDIEAVEGTEYLMSLDDFDRWSGGHIFNQLERMKTASPELRNKCFDLLQDYKTLEKMLNAEVYSLLQVMNEPVNRAIAHISASITPEAAMEMLNEVQNLKDEIDNYNNGAE